MSFSSFIIVIFLAFVFATLGVLYIRKIHKDTHRRREEKKNLLLRIETLRLPKMLKSLGISFANYFYKVPFEEIKECVIRCETCKSTDLCDEKLRTTELNPSDIDFCPNQEHLSQFSRAKNVPG